MMDVEIVPKWPLLTIEGRQEEKKKNRGSMEGSRVSPRGRTGSAGLRCSPLLVAELAAVQGSSCWRFQIAGGLRRGTAGFAVDDRSSMSHVRPESASSDGTLGRV